MGYGRRLLAALPPMGRCRRGEALAWLANWPPRIERGHSGRPRGYQSCHQARSAPMPRSRGSALSGKFCTQHALGGVAQLGQAAACRSSAP
jgi:hypothetical protein